MCRISFVREASAVCLSDVACCVGSEADRAIGWCWEISGIHAVGVQSPIGRACMRVCCQKE
jgi:hypothetical protein